MTRTYAIAAADLTERHVLVGDSICPARYGAGLPVNAVSVESDNTYAIVAGSPVDLLSAETVYVAR